MPQTNFSVFKVATSGVLSQSQKASTHTDIQAALVGNHAEAVGETLSEHRDV